MTITPTAIHQAYILKPKVFEDARGYFFESFHQQKFEEQTGIHTHFVQDNESMSNYGVIRGLHAQQGEYAQAKLIRAIRGKILDVLVDARPESPTFKTIVTYELSEENRYQLFVPKGCLHGFSVLADQTIISYKCDAFYDKNSEIGVYPLDTHLDIDWKIPTHLQILSEKDKALPSWEDFLRS